METLRVASFAVNTSFEPHATSPLLKPTCYESRKWPNSTRSKDATRQEPYYWEQEATRGRSKDAAS